MKIKVTSLIPNPEQPRLVIDQAGLRGLADSISEHGLLNPISVEGPLEDGRYIILDGERRWRAHQIAGLEEIEVYVSRPALDGAGKLQRAMLGIIGNMQRQDLNIIERAMGFLRLREMGLTYQEVGKIVGMAQSMIAVNIRLLELPAEVKELYAQGKLPFDARVVDAFITMDPERAVRLATVAAERSMTVKRILWLVGRDAWKARPLNEPKNPDQSAVARRNPIFLARSEFGHWNALAQLRIQNDELPNEKIRQAAIQTCQACVLYEDASQNVCRDCPAVDLLKRLI